jgi:hypothetical protein
VVQWGDSTQISTSKAKVQELIKTYVDKNYPKKVEQYNQELKDLKSKKISSVDSVTFIDKNLMWQDDNNTVTLKFNSLESRIYCRKLRIASRKDWRVPKYSELATLIDYTKHNPANINGIQNIKPDKYWSVTKDTTDKLKYWYVDFKYGQTATTAKSNRFYLRCVRDISKQKGKY